MLQASTLCSTDFADYAWTEVDLAPFNAYMANLSPPPRDVASSFDRIVEQNLRLGLYLAQRDALIRSTRDPKLSTRHRIVHAEIIVATNSKSGMAYPGYAHLAQVTGYSETTIATTIHELTQAGYLASSRRAPAPGRRALAHYTVIKPTVAKLQAAITTHVEALREQHARSGTWKGTRPWEPDLNPTVKHRDVPNLNPAVGVSAPEFNPAVEVRKADDFNPVIGVDLNPVGATVTSKGTGRNTPATPQGGNGLGHVLDGQAIALQAAFDVFWRVFPEGRKKGRGAAADVFGAIASGKHARRRATVEEMVEGARRYAATRPDPKYVPLPKTWLSEGRWADDVAQPDPNTQAQYHLEDALSRLRAEEDAAAWRQ